MGKMEGNSDNNDQDDHVFNNDDLTWSVVSEAAGAEEPTYATRGTKGVSEVDKGKIIASSSTQTRNPTNVTAIYAPPGWRKANGVTECSHSMATSKKSILGCHENLPHGSLFCSIIPKYFCGVVLSQTTILATDSW